MIKRLVASKLTSSKKSLLILGPRQTGKSTLMRSLKPDISINLADQAVFSRYLADQGLLRRTVGTEKTILIDEVQRIPSLLNTVQALIDEDKSRQFFLTGSSARKLRRGQANLLPGRIHDYLLGPLIPLELGAKFDPRLACSKGLLPDPYLDNDERSWKKTLRTYASTYLREEIQAESLTRNLEGFSRFFNIAAAWSGEFLDFSKIASLAEIERTSAKRYFEILEDTLITYRLEPYTRSEKLRLIRHPKFYFFDVGVLNGALGNFNPSPDRIGKLFEHLVLQTIRSTAQALDKDIRMSVFRTASGSEVDLILECDGNTFAIEIKSGRKVQSGDFKGLNSFSKFVGKKLTNSFVVSMDPLVQKFENGTAIPFSQLWSQLDWD